MVLTMVGNNDDICSVLKTSLLKLSQEVAHITVQHIDRLLHLVRIGSVLVTRVVSLVEVEGIEQGTIFKQEKEKKKKRREKKWWWERLAGSSTNHV